jgi:hypothetical protein
VTRRLFRTVRTREGEIGGLVANDSAQFVDPGPVGEDPDHVRDVRRIGALEAVSESNGWRRDDRVHERDVRLGNGELDVYRHGVGNPDLVRLDVYAQSVHVGELRKGVATDSEGSIRRSIDGQVRDGDMGVASALGLILVEAPSAILRCGRPVHRLEPGPASRLERPPRHGIV